MAADGIPGPKNQPQFLVGGAPDLGADENAIADYAAKVGNRRVGSTAERLAATGLDLWQGLEWEDTTDGGVYTVKSGAWYIRSMPHRQMTDATILTIYPRTQTGFGKITGGTTSAASEALTFPTPFSAFPVVTVNYIGYRASGPFNMVGLSSASALIGAGTTPTASGCTIKLENPTGGILNSASDYYYSWIAVGAA